MSIVAQIVDTNRGNLHSPCQHSYHWDSSEQWSASIEVCACSCTGVWFPVCEFEFCPAFDKNLLKMFEFCPAFDKKFALNESQFVRIKEQFGALL